VATGEYSDHTVHVFFLDKAMAEAHVAQLRADADGWRQDARIEGYLLADTTLKKIRIYRRWVRISVSDKAVQEDKEWSDVSWEYDHGIVKKVMGARTFTASAFPDCVMIEVFGTSKSHVDKSVQDRIIKVKAGVFDLG
jgi:hypothetical protein